MDLVLVVPPVPNIDSDGRRVTSSARLGIAYLAAYARAKGHEVITINAPSSGLSVADVISRIMSLRPAAAGITMSFQHLDLLPGVELVRGLRAAGYKGHITTGGYTPTFEWQTILERVPEIDSVVVGEGEVTLEELLRAVKAGTPVESVSGLALMKTGKPELTAPRPLIDDLDTVPFPLRDPGDMNGIASISTSRGCYGRCSFCSVRTFYLAGTGRPWRGRSPQNVVDEVALLHGQFGCNQFLFVDDNFIGPGSRGRERARAIADELIARRLQIKFGIACRANDVDLALFTRLKQAGLRTVFIGIESGTQRQLDMYGKAVTIDENKRALHILRQLGLKMDAGFIMFDPDVTLEELEANLHFLRETQLYRCESGLYNQLVHVYPFPGTAIHERLANEGRLIAEEVWGGITKTLRFSFADGRVTAVRELVQPFYHRLLSMLDFVLDEVALADQSKHHEDSDRLRRWLDNLGLFGLTLMERAIAHVKFARTQDEGRADLVTYASAYAARFFPEHMTRAKPEILFLDLAEDRRMASPAQ